MSERKNESIVICISGMAGSGKSTLAKRIAQRYGLQYISGGDALKEIALERGYKPKNGGWWESEEGLKFLEERMQNKSFDKEVDAKLSELANKGDIVLDSWTMPWLLKIESFKIWLKVSIEKRAERAAHRDRMNIAETMSIIKERDKSTKLIYEKLYGFSLDDDLSPFDLILDTDKFKPNEVFKIVSKVIDVYIQNKKYRK